MCRTYCSVKSQTDSDFQSIIVGIFLKPNNWIFLKLRESINFNGVKKWYGLKSNAVHFHFCYVQYHVNSSFPFFNLTFNACSWHWIVCISHKFFDATSLIMILIFWLTLIWFTSIIQNMYISYTSETWHSLFSMKVERFTCIIHNLCLRCLISNLNRYAISSS